MAEKLDTLQVVEIAEGAEVQLRVAGPSARALAWILDFIIKGAIMIVLSIAVMIFVATAFAAVAGEEGSNVALGIMMILAFVVEWFYHIIFESLPKSATPGKMMMGLRVTQLSGAPITVKQAILRNLLRIADMQPAPILLIYDAIPVFLATSLVGLTTCILTKRFQRLGDLVAGTVVVYADRHTKVFEEKIYTDIEAQAPGLPLSREEQKAIVTFSDRLADWSDPRKEELASHAEPLTQTQNPSQGVIRILEIAKWIRTSG